MSAHNYVAPWLQHHPFVASVRFALAGLAMLFGMASALAAAPAGYLLNLGLYRPSTNQAFAYSDLNSRTFTWYRIYGAQGDAPVVGDFDGNGVRDLAIFRNGTWFVDTNHDSQADSLLYFGGVAGDIALTGEFDGDGVADLVIFRGGAWYIRASSTGNVTLRYFGGDPNDRPVIADFDGDGVSDLGVYRSGRWYITTNGTSSPSIDVFFGGATQDKPCAVDWDHDGKVDLCIYRDGVWYFSTQRDGVARDAYSFGAPGDLPLSGGVFDLPGAIYVKAGAPLPRDGSSAHPFNTIQAAANAATANAVIRVAAGTYPENVVLADAQKNGLKLLGVSQRGVSLSPQSGDALVAQGTTGHLVEGFTIGNGAARGIVLIGGAGSVVPSVPGATMNVAFSTVKESVGYGILVTGSSQIDVRYSHINRSRTKSGIGTQSGSPTATLYYNEVAQNGYTVQAGSDGCGVEAQQSSNIILVGNYFHDNNRFGVLGINDTHLVASFNTIESSKQNGILICGAGAGGDTSTAQLTGNWIAGNGTSGQFNGVEIYDTCVRSHVISYNSFVGNTLNGLEIASSTITLTANTFANNQIGITLVAGTGGSADTVATIRGNAFSGNSLDGIYSQLIGTGHTLSAAVGGMQPGESNNFSNHGLHAIGCETGGEQLTCPHLGNTFSGNANDIEASCPGTCVK